MGISTLGGLGQFLLQLLFDLLVESLLCIGQRFLPGPDLQLPLGLGLAFSDIGLELGFEMVADLVGQCVRKLEGVTA